MTSPPSDPDCPLFSQAYHSISLGSTKRHDRGHKKAELIPAFPIYVQG